MDLLKYVAPKALLKRRCAPGVQTPKQAPQAARPAPRMAVREPIASIVDRYEANLPSLHKLICLNRELLEHREAETQEAEAVRVDAVRRAHNRVLGAVPLATLALEIGQLSQAGLTSAHASGVALATGTAAVVLACMGMVSLGTAARAQRRKADLRVRQDELKGAIDRETRAATRTLGALQSLRTASATQSLEATQVARAPQRVDKAPVQPHGHAAGARPQAFSDVVTPPPGWPQAPSQAPRPMAMDADIVSGTTFGQL